MARSDINETATARRILANVQQRRETEQTARPDQSARADQQDLAERLLSRPVKLSTEKTRRRKRAKPNTSVLRILVTSVIVIGAIAFIIWFRDLAQEYGIIWLGDE